MMNENIIFSPKKAEELNKMVNSSIAEHLFLLCNYNPDSIAIFSEDAKFMQASLNMYKFLVDAGICNNLKGLRKKYNITYDYMKIDNIIKNINAIRTTLGHNVDERNGTDDSRKTVEQWFLSIVGKKQLNDFKEYEKALKEIERYGDECISILTAFIEIAGKSDRKCELIKDWEKLIIDFYKRPSSKNIFEGQLMLAYQSRVGVGGRGTKIDVANWVREMLFYEEQSQIDNLQEIVRKSSFSASVLRKVEAKIEDNEKNIAEKKSCIARFVKRNIDSLRIFDYWDYYLYMIPNKIQDYMDSGRIFSLLPQDVIQQIIEEDFKNVPI